VIVAAAGIFTSGCDDPEPADQHGVVKLEFAVSAGDAPWAGTARIEITLDYLEDLVDFYASNPNWSQDGADGGPVFGTKDEGGEGWADRLCGDYDGAGDIPCTIAKIDQELDIGNPHLTVHYDILDADKIGGRVLHFGPIPNQELLGSSPRIRVGSNGAVRGVNGTGNLVWETKSFNPSTAVTGQGQAITIKAGLP
jgi:hypothetical protein